MSKVRDERFGWIKTECGHSRSKVLGMAPLGGLRLAIQELTLCLSWLDKLKASVKPEDLLNSIHGEAKDDGKEELDRCLKLRALAFF